MSGTVCPSYTTADCTPRPYTAVSTPYASDSGPMSYPMSYPRSPPRVTLPCSSMLGPGAGRRGEAGAVAQAGD